MSDGYSRGERSGTTSPSTDFSARQPEVTKQLDEAFDVLSDPYCRCILYHLHRMQGDVAERSELEDSIRDFMNVDGYTLEFVRDENITLDVHHRVLPRLQAAGYVEYDTLDETVRYRETPALVDWLERAYREEIGGGV